MLLNDADFLPGSSPAVEIDQHFFSFQLVVKVVGIEMEVHSYF